ncbi:MAG: hypothetical protein ACO3ZW_07280 [Opitutales bacterium]|jgi:hypothetical protein
MKITGLKSCCTSGFSLLAAALILHGGASFVQADRLIARPLTPQEVHDNHLDAIPSGGLFTVGKGEPVYLEVLVDDDKTVSGAIWNLIEKPFGSQAFIDVSPIPMEMPIYSPAMRESLILGDRMLLVPDVNGVYFVEVVVNTSAGDVVLSEQITAADYVGVGMVNDPAKTRPDWPQCALCHPQRAADYMGTGHATFLEEAIDGIKSSHYREDCIKCHTLGGHAPDLENGSFGSVAADLGWSWPTVLEGGNWAAMPLELKEKANIQCEHCHGAGGEHFGIAENISVSLDSGDCAQCHDEAPYHNKNRQWERSGHSRAPARTSGSCAGCHTAEGFINIHKNDDFDGLPLEVKGEALVCSACHDPHSNHGENHQLRTTGDVELMNGHVVTAGGNGKMCLNCHMARRVADDYVQGSVSSHFGPHYGVQGDLFNGTNAIEYDGKVIGGPSVHLYTVEDSCVGCHMQSVPNSDPAKNMAGEHTFNMTWDPNNTPDDHHDDVALTGVCTDCHGPLDSFDMRRYDYNYDGVTEGVQTEVHHLLEALALKLHPVGSPEVIRGDSGHEYSAKEKKALYNYLCVEEDGSHGVHNPRYITALLRASIEDLGDPLNSILDGVNIPVGGPWYYSPWFEFYSPTGTAGWIYHFTHGYLYVAGSGDNLQIFDPVLDKWLYTNADLYPVLLDVADGTWIYFQGRFGDMRYFYNYDTGKWDVVN